MELGSSLAPKAYSHKEMAGNGLALGQMSLSMTLGSRRKWRNGRLGAFHSLSVPGFRWERNRPRESPQTL